MATQVGYVPIRPYYFIQFLDPTHKKDFIGGYPLRSAWNYVFDVFSKIISGYGIYQLISAFRRNSNIK